MARRSWGLIALGLILILLGIIFSLQGANVLGGSPVMSGNSTYIYVGGVVALIGLILAVLGYTSRSKRANVTSPQPSNANPKVQ